MPGGRLKGDARAITISSEIDRIYQNAPDTVVLEDGSLGRRITIAKRGSSSTVVWNPWIKKSGRLGDMGQDGYREMVCIETANAGSDAVTIAPGERHRHQAEISVENY